MAQELSSTPRIRIIVDDEKRGEVEYSPPEVKDLVFTRDNVVVYFAPDRADQICLHYAPEEIVEIEFGKAVRK